MKRKKKKNLLKESDIYSLRVPDKYIKELMDRERRANLINMQKKDHSYSFKPNMQKKDHSYSFKPNIDKELEELEIRDSERKRIEKRFNKNNNPIRFNKNNDPISLNLDLLNNIIREDDRTLLNILSLLFEFPKERGDFGHFALLEIGNCKCGKPLNFLINSITHQEIQLVAFCKDHGEIKKISYFKEEVIHKKLEIDLEELSKNTELIIDWGSEDKIKELEKEIKRLRKKLKKHQL